MPHSVEKSTDKMRADPGADAFVLRSRMSLMLREKRFAGDASQWPHHRKHHAGGVSYLGVVGGLPRAIENIATDPEGVEFIGWILPIDNTHYRIYVPGRVTRKV